MLKFIIFFMLLTTSVNACMLESVCDENGENCMATNSDKCFLPEAEDCERLCCNPIAEKGIYCVNGCIENCERINHIIDYLKDKPNDQ